MTDEIFLRNGVKKLLGMSTGLERLALWEKFFETLRSQRERIPSDVAKVKEKSLVGWKSEHVISFCISSWRLWLSSYSLSTLSERSRFQRYTATSSEVMKFSPLGTTLMVLIE